jgi:hypothetical protein
LKQISLKLGDKLIALALTGKKRFLSAACGAKRIETNKAVLAGRKQASVEEVASFLDQTEQASQAILNRQVAQGVLSEAREKGQ